MNTTAWDEFTHQARRVLFVTSPFLVICLSVFVLRGWKPALNLGCFYLNAVCVKYNIRNARKWAERNRTSPYAEAGDWWLVVMGYGLALFSGLIASWNLGLFLMHI